VSDQSRGLSQEQLPRCEAGTVSWINFISVRICGLDLIAESATRLPSLSPNKPVFHPNDTPMRAHRQYPHQSLDSGIGMCAHSTGSRQ
jgi:hypothetical protein